MSNRTVMREKLASVLADRQTEVLSEVIGMTNKDLVRYALLVERAAGHLEGEIVPVCFCSRVRPSVREAVKKAGYRLLLSSGRMM